MEQQDHLSEEYRRFLNHQDELFRQEQQRLRMEELERQKLERESLEQ